jgi:hypothetical protein
MSYLKKPTEHDKIVALIVHAHAQLIEWIAGHSNGITEEELEITMLLDREARQVLIKEFGLNLDKLYDEARLVYSRMRGQQLIKIAGKKAKEEEQAAIIKAAWNILKCDKCGVRAPMLGSLTCKACLKDSGHEV